MFKNANIVYEIKNSKRRRYYAKFQDLALKRRREIFYEMDPRIVKNILAELTKWIHYMYFILSYLHQCSTLFLKVHVVV